MEFVKQGVDTRQLARILDLLVHLCDRLPDTSTWCFETVQRADIIAVEGKVSSVMRSKILNHYGMATAWRGRRFGPLDFGANYVGLPEISMFVLSTPPQFDNQFGQTKSNKFQEIPRKNETFEENQGNYKKREEKQAESRCL